jgi:hypothetical protein
MMLMAVIGMMVQLCRADAVDGCRRAWGEEGTCGPSPVNRACGAVLHSLRSLRPLRR